MEKKKRPDADIPLLAAMQPDSEPKLSFEEALKRLEGIVFDLEGGTLGLDQSLAKYELGVGLLNRCHALLRDAEQRIELITGIDEEGKPLTEAFESGSDPSPARGTRKGLK